MSKIAKAVKRLNAAAEAAGRDIFVLGVPKGMDLAGRQWKISWESGQQTTGAITEELLNEFAAYLEGLAKQ